MLFNWKERNQKYLKDPDYYNTGFTGSSFLLQNPTDEIRVEVQAAEKLFYEEAIFKKLVYTECGLLIVALLGGVLWEILVRNKNSGKTILVMRVKIQFLEFF